METACVVRIFDNIFDFLKSKIILILDREKIKEISLLKHLLSEVI